MRKNNRNLAIAAALISLVLFLAYQSFRSGPPTPTALPAVINAKPVIASQVSSTYEALPRQQPRLKQAKPAALQPLSGPRDVEEQICILHGLVQFERLEFLESSNGISTEYQLTPFNPSIYPSRYIRVNLRDREGKLLAKTFTNGDGEYLFELSHCDPTEQLYLELVAAMRIESIDASKAIWVSVQSNKHQRGKTNKYLQYTVTSPFYFSINYGISQQDFLLETGFNQLDGFNERRSHSQSFAILDTLAKGFDMFKSHGIDLPGTPEPLTVLWTRGKQRNEQSDGYYKPANNLIFIKGSTPVDNQSRPKTTNSEWNEHTIMHELGHWYMHKVVGRSDSRGGIHSGYGFSDLTLSLSEGIAGMVARFALNDWQDKRANSDITKATKTLAFLAKANKELSDYRRHFKDSNGYPYHRPAFAFSPFDEVSNMLFLLSLVDARAQFSEQATRLANEIGLLGLHQSLLKAASKPQPYTIYSVAAQLIEDNPILAGELELLANELNIGITGGSCGEGQWQLRAHVVNSGALLDPESQFPICSEIWLDTPLELTFNGALQSLSPARPGTVRYVYFRPEFDAHLSITSTDVADSLGKNHQFSFDISYLGNRLVSSTRIKHLGAHRAQLRVEGGKTYILRVLNSSFNNPNYKSEESLTSVIQIDLL